MVAWGKMIRLTWRTEMRHFIGYALACFTALLFGSAYAGDGVTPEKIVAKHAKQQCKKVHGKCVKQQGKHKKSKAKKRPKPLAPVKPTIEKEYHPPLFTTSPKKQLAIHAYKQCMYDDGHPDADRIERALALNLSYRNERDIAVNSQKTGREICLADALGIKRYETQEAIDRAKGIELFEVSSQFIYFPDDEGNRLPAERRFARPWVKEYIEAFARDLNTHLLSRRPTGNTKPVPLLRVNSLVRSLADQAKQKSGAQCKNEICSTHLTGSTMDIANSEGRVTEEARKWIRKRLLKDRSEGKIIMFEEFERPHFHVFVIPPEFVPKTEE